MRLAVHMFAYQASLKSILHFAHGAEDRGVGLHHGVVDFPLLLGHLRACAEREGEGGREGGRERGREARAHTHSITEVTAAHRCDMYEHTALGLLWIRWKQHLAHSTHELLSTRQQGLVEHSLPCVLNFALSVNVYVNA